MNQIDEQNAIIERDITSGEQTAISDAEKGTLSNQSLINKDYSNMSAEEIQAYQWEAMNQIDEQNAIIERDITRGEQTAISDAEKGTLSNQSLMNKDYSNMSAEEIQAYQWEAMNQINREPTKQQENNPIHRQNVKNAKIAQARIQVIQEHTQSIQANTAGPSQIEVA